MSLLSITDVNSKPTAQQKKEMEAPASCYKKVDLVYQGLIEHFNNSQSIEEFKSAEFVQSAISMIFLFKLSEVIFTQVFLS